jgi:hypothetical protein
MCGEVIETPRPTIDIDCCKEDETKLYSLHERFGFNQTYKEYLFKETKESKYLNDLGSQELDLNDAYYNKLLNLQIILMVIQEYIKEKKDKARYTKYIHEVRESICEFYHNLELETKNKCYGNSIKRSGSELTICGKYGRF